ncbi:MAG: ASCH domain-containing protein, partial [Nitrosopumilus sp.]
MKCLSVSQPFADLIISGKKIIELRKWNTNFRGEFLIHAPIKIRIEDCKRLKINKKLEELLRIKKIRSLSGIAVVSVLTKPYPCPGNCLYCPT